MTSENRQPQANYGQRAAAPVARARRVYPSTFVLTTLLAIALVLPNVMGDIVLSPERHWPGMISLESGVSPHLEHGWPLVYLWRKPSGLGKRSSILNYTLWGVHQSVTRFRPARLAVNVAVGVALLVSGGWLFNRWRRRRVRLGQFGLLELAIAVAVIGALLGFFARDRLRGARERAALEEIRRERSKVYRALLPDDITIQPAKPTWLRDLLGDALFEPADAVVSLGYATDKELAFVDRLPRLISVSVRSHVSDDDLKKLEACPRLESLQIEQALPRKGDPFAVPRLPHLRALFASHTSFRGDGIEHLVNLERLEVSNSQFNDRAASALPSLKRLTYLSLHNTRVTDASLPSLRRCTQLEILALPDELSEASANELVVALPNCRIHHRDRQLRKSEKEK